VRRRKDGRLPREGRQPGGPSVCPKAGAVEVSLASTTLLSTKDLFEIRDNVTTKQLDRIHDARVCQVPHLHEAEYLVDPDFLVFLQHLDDRIGIPHGERA